MNNPSDKIPTKDSSESPVDVNDAKTKTVYLRNTLLIVLASVSGFMDALSFLELNVFASVLTGNTVLLGLAISSGNILHIIVPLVALTGFIGGVALGNRLAEPNLNFQKKIWPATVTRTLYVELIVLSIFTTGGFIVGESISGLALYVFIMLATVSMGIQSSAVRALGVPHISTTYITGTWTSLIISLSRQHSAKTVTNKDERKSGLVLSIGVVVVYILSAIVGGVTVANLSLMAALIPVIGIGLVVVIAKARMS
jgi:uncharacterized membrane protein YoaK (UPF0700 family)